MKIGIKKKIVIWYTVWMAVLCAILLYTVFLSSDFLLSFEIQEDLVEAVMDARKDYIGSDGRKMDFFDDGIFLMVCSPDGSVERGDEPAGFPFLAYGGGKIEKISSGMFDWYVYDSSMEDGSFIRGVYPIASMSRFFSSAFIAALILLPIAVFFAAMGGYFITKRALRPMERMVETANSIANGTDLSKRMDIERAGYEIKELADTFDLMLSRLELSFKRERQFTSDASHELRTPVAVIRAHAEYALSHSNEESTKEVLVEIINQVDRMARLIEQMLALARADGGSQELSFERIDLGELAQIAIASLKNKADEYGVSLFFEGNEGVVVKVDETMMTRLFINLIDNGICYNREGGFVKVSVSPCKEGATICVWDNGIGMPPDAIKRIWDRFYQVDPSRSRKGSSGLGLPMVKWIASVHNGYCSVESVEGLGSRFTVVIKG